MYCVNFAENAFELFPSDIAYIYTLSYGNSASSTYASAIYGMYVGGNGLYVHILDLKLLYLYNNLCDHMIHKGYKNSFNNN
jgi:hypothetical protein